MASRVLVAGLAALSCAVTPAHGASRALRPSADFSVSVAQPTRNYGAAERLVVRRRPLARAFVRFALPAALAPGERAVLWIYPLRDSRAGLVLRHASDVPWREHEVTFADAPRTGPRAVRSGPLRRDRWQALDVTSLTNASRAVSLALATTGATAVVLTSREGGTKAPRLTVQRVGTGAASATA